ncbi:MAG: 2-C-methyl-D-erythritol 4-phosphate cytidylyltransferase [Candidatus Heimdallarchaeota archaeon]|nr:2-C-methyl-D-erythritol 4-phosphate cytidylyltransferase [Candidatus Heimdallarchaeota archaeon]
MKTTFIILAGGIGERLGFDIPKQFVPLNGKPIIEWTYLSIKSHPKVNEIVIVTHESWIDQVKKIAPNAIITTGGLTRQQSSYKGLLACPKDTDYVLIHDSVRPLLSHKVIDRCLDKLEKGSNAVLTVIPSADTLVEIENDKVVNIPQRSRIFRAQTPQGFIYQTILKAHETTKMTNSTDDGRLMMESGYDLDIVKGDPINLKVTQIEDLHTAERLFQSVSKKTEQEIDIKGKKIVIFGGTSGIGKETAIYLQSLGAEVTILGRKDVDVRNSQEIERYFEKSPEFDVIIVSTGILHPEKISNLSDDLIENTYRTNLFGPINICKFGIRKLRPGSHIVLIGSSSAYRGRAGYSIYSSSKSALTNFIQAASAEFSEFGIQINMVSPPRTRTRMYTDLHPNADPGALYDPKKVAKVVGLYCVGSESGHIVDLKLQTITHTDPTEKAYGGDQ